MRKVFLAALLAGILVAPVAFAGGTATTTYNNGGFSLNGNAGISNTNNTGGEETTNSATQYGGSTGMSAGQSSMAAGIGTTTMGVGTGPVGGVTTNFQGAQSATGFTQGYSVGNAGSSGAQIGSGFNTLTGGGSFDFNTYGSGYTLTQPSN